MKTTVVVLYRGALAYYTVSERGDGSYEAQLLRFRGSTDDEPPRCVHFIKQGRHCSGDSDNQDLMDDLLNAVETESKYGNLLLRNNSNNAFINTGL